MYTIGIDVGNYDTKTQTTNTPSGYTEQKLEPKLASEFLFYNGSYYIPTTERFNYSMDKTENRHALILSLFGIAKEILAKVSTNPEYKYVSTQELINRNKKIKIGIGLPAGHYEKLAAKTRDYYLDIFKEDVVFKYHNEEFQQKKGDRTFSFCITSDMVNIFPQDFVAVYGNTASAYASEYDRYIIIGIGGGTSDIIPVEGNKVDGPRCTTIEMGTTHLYKDAARKVAKYSTINISNEEVERILLGKKSVLSDNADIIEIINGTKQEFVEKLLDGAKSNGFELREVPVIFVGGGCLLIKDILEQSKLLNKYEFIEDTHANAKAYARYMEQE